ncbi:MAG: DNA polymerase III subunit beta [Planctomycetota bacterium]
MKITCARLELLDGLALAGGIVSPKSPKKILRDVKLIARENEGLEIQATDLEMAIRFQVHAVEVTRPGEIVAPASELQAIVREIGDGTIEIESVEEAIKIRYSDGYFELMGDQADDFPLVPTFDVSQVVEIPAKEFVRLSERSMFATAREKTRYAINGVLLWMDSERVRMVGTDGRRMALIESPVETGLSEPKSAIIPSRGMQQVNRLIQGEDLLIQLNIGESQLMVRTPRAELATRLVEGEFAPYEKVIPDHSEYRVELDRDRFLANARRSALLTTVDSRTVRLEFNGEELIFKSYSSGVGQSEIRMEGVAYSGPPVEISFNPEFLTEALKVAENEVISMDFTNGSQAAKFTLGESFVYVVMPVTV